MLLLTYLLLAQQTELIVEVVKSCRYVSTTMA